MKQSCVLVAIVLAMAGSVLQATTVEGDGSVIVESRTGGKNFADYSDTAATVTNNSWQNSTAKSSAPGTTAGIGSRFQTNAFINTAAYFQASPTLPANPFGQWEVYITIPSGSSPAPTVTAGVTTIGATGLAATTTAFSNSGLNTWKLVGTIVLDAGVNKPTVRFNEMEYTAGASYRLIADAVKFVPVPEPATLAFVAIGFCGVFIRRRR